MISWRRNFYRVSSCFLHPMHAHTHHTHTRTHTRPRRPARAPSPACRRPAAPQGARDDRGHLAPRVLPPAGPRRVGPPSARAGAEAAHPFIPEGREHRGHSQSPRRGGPAQAMLGVVVQAWGPEGPRGEGGAEVGPRQQAQSPTHAHSYTHLVSWVYTHTHIWTRTPTHGSLHTHSHVYSLPPT